MSAQPLTIVASPLESNGLSLGVVRREGQTVKFTLRTADALEIESVIIPMGAEIDGRDKTWRTLCVSSQVGCARGCAFCMTARMGLLRNLTVDEIVGQVTAARRYFGADVRNLVFMGMGEPLDNVDAVVESIRILHEARENPVPRRRVTVSTVGRCEGILKLAALRWRRLNLAVSLNASNDDIRSQIMPINRIEPMEKLRKAIAAYPVRAGGHVLIEYVLLAGINDRPEHARELAAYLKGLRTCVNVIPWNPCEGMEFQTPDEGTTDRFMQTLLDAGQMVFRRRTKGVTALGACGQLGNPELRNRKPELGSRK